MTAAEAQELLRQLEQQKIEGDEPIVEDDDDDEDDEDDEDEDGDEAEGPGADASGRSKQSRSEKKSRKAMLKLGMKTITGVSRVTVKKSKNVLYRGTHWLRLWAQLQRREEDKNVLRAACQHMENLVMQIFANHGWRFSQGRELLPLSKNVIFGEAKIEDLSSQLQTQAAEQFKAPDPSTVISKAEPSAAAQDDEEVDETGVEPKDIELVMTQASVSRPRAVKALKDANGDIVTAIMELTN